MRVLEMVVEAAEVCTFNAASSTSNPPCHEGENQDCRGHTYCPHREGEEKATARRAVGLSTQTDPNSTEDTIHKDDDSR